MVGDVSCVSRLLCVMQKTDGIPAAKPCSLQAIPSQAYTGVQKQITATVYFSGEQLLLFWFGTGVQ